MNDYIIRATAANDQIRAFAAVTTQMVENAREHHNTSPVATAALGRLLTAGAMMGRMSVSQPIPKASWMWQALLDQDF